MLKTTEPKPETTLIDVLALLSLAGCRCTVCMQCHPVHIAKKSRKCPIHGKGSK